MSKLTKLTKKAIEYYSLRGLISPSVAENGYREFCSQDVEKLNKIRILRKLDVSIDEIERILKDKGNSVLQSVSVKKELDYQRNSVKKSILQKLSQGKSYEEIFLEIQAIEQEKNITDKLLEAFPGYYGRFICMHFARFLNEPIQTEAQQAAYETIIYFLDNLPQLELPQELEDYLSENTEHIGTEHILEMLESTKKTYENPDEFLANNKELLEQYMKYKKSNEYKNSPACRIMELMKQFNSSNGYNDVFIPAMKQLSPSYAEYYRLLEAANEKLLAKYPEIK